MSTTIKTGPIAPITASFPDSLIIDGNKFEYKVTATDRDNDVFNVALADGYILNLEKDMIINTFESDVRYLLEVSLKSKKVKLDGKKVLIINTLFVDLIFRGSKISNMILNFLKEYCSNNNVEYILLLSKPIVSYKLGIAKVQSDTYIKEMQNILNSLYAKNGFEYLNKTKKIMYFKI